LARDAVESYYRSVSDTEFDALKKASENALSLESYGKAAEMVLIGDMSTPSLPRETRIKAMFALAVFRENGQGGCEGVLIPSLLRVARESEGVLKAWALLVLAIVSDSDQGEDASNWDRWWKTTGSKKYGDTCDGK